MPVGVFVAHTLSKLLKSGVMGVGVPEARNPPGGAL